MKSIIICPNCGKVLAYNSYFGAYICSNCNWESYENYDENEYEPPKNKVEIIEGEVDKV